MQDIVKINKWSMGDNSKKIFFKERNFTFIFMYISINKQYLLYDSIYYLLYTLYGKFERLPN